MKEIEEDVLKSKSESDCVFKGWSSSFGSLAYCDKATQVTNCEVFKYLFPNCYIGSSW